MAKRGRTKGARTVFTIAEALFTLLGIMASFGYAVRMEGEIVVF